MLFLMVLLPILGSCLLAVSNFKASSLSIRVISLLCAGTSFFINIIVAVKFDYLYKGFQFIHNLAPGFVVGIDGLSLPLLLLTTFLFLLSVVFALYNMQSNNLRIFLALLLLLEGLTVGVFVSLDIVMFYIFFESVLIPMFFIIGMWGHEDRIYATFKLFLYTLSGSLLFLIAILYIYFFSGKISDIGQLTYILSNYLNLKAQKWVWIAFFISFAIKIPVIPFHTWLPDAHVQAPTVGSVLLAGILIKVGTYALLRFSLPMLPEASMYFSNFVMILSIIGVIYASLISFVQTNIKKLIAYSSIAHMGFVTAGIFSFNEYGISGAVFQMISHGLVSAALFICVGILYNRTHTLEIVRYSGLAKTMPKFSIMFIFFSMASIALPGTSGFIGEFLSILGIFHYSKLFSIFITIGVVLGALYMLFLCKRIIWSVPNCDLINCNLNKNELFILVILAAFILLFGLYPYYILLKCLTPFIEQLSLRNFVL
ncbi:proton-translocating NADH-quinone oxidoreductase, chain M family protein [Ehrlichia chaffeensis str. Heartland]|uniref:complex I subunit 4 family protein n=1 Tax=Ehrlichia chaffeensis TaxID=945 RepID=UPI000444C207|nr:NADH-quinone oxidoreductase subunit M [Ehrlichia chaffeensis]AHX03646.1 proton-translocating NADH-quinone oxidoreductase, chain M family protein [Ehrlichia chaffeensis str. Heartland]AHX08468.1 proton-translocating NADH-quinone oxidoreductase, chain M family protein [Ehrlichia chaffeensis str. Saint Vincent]AHX09443.1 proton-translocating NADH-quinone oxidoreductase, chain M family protein [Ehrlichia chaffeensis str. Wakulla]AHX10165.1 proton-translocating NADH-quinone oxidoreductase, chain 